jgi:hypothetical protein
MKSYEYTRKTYKGWEVIHDSQGYYLDDGANGFTLIGSTWAEAKETLDIREADGTNGPSGGRVSK